MNELKARALQLLRASADAPSATSPRAGAGDDPSTPSSSSKKCTPSKQGAKKRTPGGGTPVTPATVGSTPGTPGGTGGSGRKGKGRARFAEFWPRDVVREGLREQHLHEGKIRVNPHRRQEAYVSLEGVPHDVKIDGYAAQNRVIDGDTVALGDERIRIENIDTPETGSRAGCLSERTRATEATESNRKLQRPQKPQEATDATKATDGHRNHKKP